MAQLESIELWSKIGSDKDSRRNKVLGVKPKDNEKPKKGRGSRRPMQTEEEPREVFTVAWKRAWERRGIDFSKCGCLRCGSHEHREGSCLERRRKITCPY